MKEKKHLRKKLLRLRLNDQEEKTLYNFYEKTSAYKL